jgi:hypothetical protein
VKHASRFISGRFRAKDVQAAFSAAAAGAGWRALTAPGLPGGRPSVRLPTFGQRQGGRVHADQCPVSGRGGQGEATRGRARRTRPAVGHGRAHMLRARRGRPRLVSRLRVRLASATKATTVRRPPQAHWRTSWANLVHMCSQCHNSRLDQTLTRALQRELLARVIDHVEGLAQARKWDRDRGQRSTRTTRAGGRARGRDDD